MNRTIHVGLSVRVALRDQSIAKWLTAKDGRKLSTHELHNMLAELLADGVEMLPVGEPCDGWDWKTGCPGHEGDIT